MTSIKHVLYNDKVKMAMVETEEGSDERIT